MTPTGRNTVSVVCRRRSAVLLWLAVIATVPCHARPIDDARKLVGSTWYTVSLLDQRAGYARSDTTLVTSATGQPQLRVVERMRARIQLAGMPDALTLDSEVATYYDADLRPERMVMRNDEFGRVREVEAVLREGNLEVTLRAGGEEAHKIVATTPAYGSEMLLTLAILRGEAKPGDRFDVDVFNPELVAIDHHQVAVTDRVQLPDGRAGYRVTSTSSLVPVETVNLIAADGTLVSSSTASILKMQLQEATETEALAAAAPLVLSSSIPTNKDITDYRHLALLKVRLRAGALGVGDLIPPTARQEVAAEDGAIVVTARRLPRGTRSVPRPVTGPEFAPFLAPSELAQVNDPGIQAKAREIIGEEKDCRLAAERIVHWVFANLEKVKSEPRLVSAREILDQKSGDCTEHAILCATLCAAVGIPAKMVTGIAYAHGAFYYHAWNEIYVGEWVEMDGAWDEVAVGAGHIRMTAGGLAPESLAKLALGAGRTLGALSAEILDYKQD